MTIGASTAYQPSEEEHMSVLLYMYANMDEMDQYSRKSTLFSSLLYSWCSWLICVFIHLI
jgi:hypothetical protein